MYSNWKKGDAFEAQSAYLRKAFLVNMVHHDYLVIKRDA